MLVKNNNINVPYEAVDLLVNAADHKRHIVKTKTFGDTRIFVQGIPFKENSMAEEFLKLWNALNLLID